MLLNFRLVLLYNQCVYQVSSKRHLEDKMRMSSGAALELAALAPTTWEPVRKCKFSAPLQTYQSETTGVGPTAHSPTTLPDDSDIQSLA